MSKSTPRVCYRKAKTTDIDFVFDSWLKEYRNSSFGRQIESDVYFPNQRRIVDRLLKISECTIACNPEDEDQIYGYAVHRRIGDVQVLSWIFVKGIYRRMGIGKNLWDYIGRSEIVTHLSRAFNSRYDSVRSEFVSQLPDNVIYNPFIDLKEACA